MVEIGKYNRLVIKKKVDFGVYLDGHDEGEILLPQKYVDPALEIGDEIEVFIYNDSDDRIIATTERPYATVGEFAFLKLVSNNQAGAFFNWGLVKDVMVPFSEQKYKMTEGNSYLVYIYLDSVSRRIVASTKLDKFLDNIPVDFEYSDEVEVIIANETELGYKAIINNQHWGLIYKNEINRKLLTGQKLTAFIAEIREDGKIDLTLFKPNIDSIDDVSLQILSTLKKENGFIPFNDKTDAEEIYRVFKLSKKTFKKSLGNLYRRRLIVFESNGIRLVSGN
jgi:uncharacterized protein